MALLTTFEHHILLSTALGPLRPLLFFFGGLLLILSCLLGGCGVGFLYAAVNIHPNAVMVRDVAV